MKAVRVHSPGGPETMKYEDVADPTPKAGEAVVKIDAAGLNYIDVYQRSGLYKLDMPLTLGLEAGGTVTAVGAGVTEVRVGDKVAYTGVPGAYAQHAAVPAAKLVTLPQGVSTRQGAAAMLQGMTAHYLACSTYPLKRGDSCLVHAAAGGVGLLLCQIAKMRGARVIGTVSTEEKAQFARAHGCDHVINYMRDDFVKRVRELTAGKGVPVVYDSVGRDTFLKSLDCLQFRGTCLLYGLSSGQVDLFDPTLLSIKGCLYLSRPSTHQYHPTRELFLQSAMDVFDVIKSGAVKVHIGQRFPLRNVAEAHLALEQRRTVGATVLIP
jgi:NADPH2:quinone reductase